MLVTKLKLSYLLLVISILVKVFTGRDRSCPLTRICRSALAQDDGTDAGAAHGHQAALQAEVVAMPRPLLWRHPVQQQHLTHDWSGLQAQVLPTLRVQTAAEETASLGELVEQGGV